ncbi:MAG: formylglycine-generating enzyme family protein [Planctomycetota bacterium]
MSSDYRAVKSEGRDGATGLWKEIVHKKSGIVLRLVHAGEFDMGSQILPEEVVRKYGGDAADYKDEHPLHKVKISEPFYIGKYEVTQKQWKAVMKYNPCRSKGDNLPSTVSWVDALEFCRKAGGWLRLPTEAEWEYACRAGSNTQWCFGDNESMLGEYAWYRNNTEWSAHEVGQKKPNAWGLYDMHGNVFEWCLDVWHSNYDGAPGDGSDWTTGEDQSHRVLRGGSWDADAWGTRSADRDWYPQGSMNEKMFDSRVGFRVVVAAEKTS